MLSLQKGHCQVRSNLEKYGTKFFRYVTQAKEVFFMGGEVRQLQFISQANQKDEFTDEKSG